MSSNHLLRSVDRVGVGDHEHGEVGVVQEFAFDRAFEEVVEPTASVRTDDDNAGVVMMCGSDDGRRRIADITDRLSLVESCVVSDGLSARRCPCQSSAGTGAGDMADRRRRKPGDGPPTGQTYAQRISVYGPGPTLIAR